FAHIPDWRLFQMKQLSLRTANLRAAMLAVALVVAGATLTPHPTFAAETTGQPTLEELLRPPTTASPLLSRSGKYLAVTTPNKGRMNLAVIDMATRKGTLLTTFEDFDVIGVHWVGDDRLVFTLGQLNSPTGPGQFNGGGLFMISRDGIESRRLAPMVLESRRRQQLHRTLEFFRTIPGSDDEIIASGNMTDAESEDLYRLNVRNGRTTLLTRGRPSSYTSEWLLDSKLVPRVVTAHVKDTLTQVVYYRAGEGDPWNEISRFDANKGPTFVPLAFESDDKTLQVASNQGRDTMAVYRYDPAAKKLGELIAENSRYDMGADASGQRVPGVLTSIKDDKIIGYRVQGSKPETIWIDEAYAKIQATLDASLKDRVNNFSRTPDGKTLLVTSYSDQAPARWYLFDEGKRTLEEIAVSRPWLDGKLVEQRPFLFKTRDGLEIPGYYFLPKGAKPGTKLPTVLHIHGGPFARADTWGSGFGVREARILASRGYAVVVPNFRITPGMGGKLYYSGFGSYGKQMSEDHEDALKWAIEQGFADPQRACISGASYGGYAALQAMVKTPGLFKCAIAGLAPTDLEYQITTLDGDTALSESSVKYWKTVVGTDDLGSKQVKDVSPVYHADKIKGAVFLYAGQDDIRVPIGQINRMNRALRSAGNAPAAYVVKEQEGHGFGKLENELDLYTQMLKFLDQQIGK
ncbi:MAG: prolyl oligopeptidase family serine peptidase, partial [Betaproteobacteria bacterium]